MIISYLALSKYYGGIMKYDSNGNLLLTKLFSNPNQLTLNLSFFQIVSIISIGDADIAINGRVLSLSSPISYSNNSSTDQVVFRIDNNGNTIWTTVLDYQLGLDAADAMTSYGSIIYSWMLSSLSYPWYFSLNGVDGSYLHSNCYTFFYYKSSDIISNWKLKLFRLQSWLCFRKLYLFVR